MTIPDNLAVEAPEAEESTAGSAMPLHRAIYEELLDEIQRRVFKPGERIPSEAALCKRFGASRITVARAIQTLQREGLVSRRPGSGTYVQARQESALQFGLLIPDLGRTEIFGPICHGMMLSPQGKPHSLSWGSGGDGSEPTVESAEQLCLHYIAQGVSGIFFAPFEHAAEKEAVNERIAKALRDAQMPTVLLDRGIAAFPDLDGFDRVSIDHYAAGYTLARHLLQHGARHIVFLSRAYAAPSVNARVAGYACALAELAPSFGASAEAVHFTMEPGQHDRLEQMLQETGADALLCANDVTAANAMQTLSRMSKRVPEDVRLVGVDDVKYAQYLPVPLTTLRQNCAELGATAMTAMLERIAHPHRAARTIHVDFELIVRTSCGAKRHEVH